MIAVGLLDNTVKVFYDDSLKFFLSLYGHKLPVMALDISYDNKLLVSGSADKTVKIWGLDFGDCHRSLIAHADSVTSIRFQPSTHYFFSSGKDGIIKYWDADRFEQILYLPGHVGTTWCLDLSYDGAYCVSCSQDRSLRIWDRTDDLVFIEEEKERELEHQVDKAIEQSNNDRFDDSIATNEDGSVIMQQRIAVMDDTTTGATLKTVETVKGGEMLMQALDLVDAEIAAINEWNQLQLANKSSTTNKVNKKPAVRPKNMLLLNLSPYKYMIRSLRLVKAPDLEQALLVMPFHYIKRFVSILLELARRGLDLELCTRCVVMLLKAHQAQIVSTRSLLSEISEIQDILLTSIGSYRSVIGTNIAGLKFMHKVDSERVKSIGFGEEAAVAVVTPTAEKRKKRKTK